MNTASGQIRQKLDEAERSLRDPFDGAMESFFVDEVVTQSKYGDYDPIVCRSPHIGNNRICGKTYTNLGNFIRHLEKPNVHGLKIGDQI